jgi:hypothetical protein
MENLIKNFINLILFKFKILTCNYITISDWDDDLIWCPSQCYKKIEYKGNQFVIYLRWRHSDPWRAEIIQCEPNYEFNIISPNSKDFKLPIKYYKDSELDKLKKEVDYLVKKWLIKNI